MATVGEEMLEQLRTAYEYQPPKLIPSLSTSTHHFSPSDPPDPAHIPAFIVHSPSFVTTLLASLASILTSQAQSGKLDVAALRSHCHIHKTTFSQASFPNARLTTEGDTTAIAHKIIHQLEVLLAVVFQQDLVGDNQECEHEIPNQGISVDNLFKLLWEDKNWPVFDCYVDSLLQMAEEDSGRAPELSASWIEHAERAIMFKVCSCLSVATISLLLGRTAGDQHGCKGCNMGPPFRRS